MARIPGIFVPLDVNYPRDRAIRRAGPDAELLFIRSLVYTKGASTDGYIADYDLDVVAVGLRNVNKSVTALVAGGLWETTDGGWQIRSWAKWNMTSDQITEVTEARSTGGGMGNHERWHVKRGIVSDDCQFCTPRRSTDRSTDRPTDSESDRSRIVEVDRDLDRDQRPDTEERPSARPGLSVVSTPSSSSPTYRESGR